MKVTTLLVTKEEAERKLLAYKRLQERQRTQEDEKLATLYKAVAGGARVINVAAAFRETGLNDKGQPRLAIARADWRNVCFHPNPGWSSNSRRGFNDSRQWNERATVANFVLPSGVFDAKLLTKNNLSSPVPHIPPELRPRWALRNYHILFQVEKWNVYPRDPFLLRRIAGMLFVVEAEWDLTELEAALLASMREGA